MQWHRPSFACMHAEAGSTWGASLEAAWMSLLPAKRRPEPRHATLLRHSASICKWRLLCLRSYTCSVVLVIIAAFCSKGNFLLSPTLERKQRNSFCLFTGQYMRSCHLICSCVHYARLRGPNRGLSHLAAGLQNKRAACPCCAQAGAAQGLALSLGRLGQVDR